jgi:hypothetical protein
MKYCKILICGLVWSLTIWSVFAELPVGNMPVPGKWTIKVTYPEITEDQMSSLVLPVGQTVLNLPDRRRTITQYSNGVNLESIFANPVWVAESHVERPTEVSVQHTAFDSFAATQKSPKFAYVQWIDDTMQPVREEEINGRKAYVFESGGDRPQTAWIDAETRLPVRWSDGWRIANFEFSAPDPREQITLKPAFEKAIVEYQRFLQESEIAPPELKGDPQVAPEDDKAPQE